MQKKILGPLAFSAEVMIFWAMHYIEVIKNFDPFALHEHKSNDLRARGHLIKTMFNIFSYSFAYFCPKPCDIPVVIPKSARPSVHT
jgi:hypothetical protein